jgi:hypothetical protein
VIVYEAMHLPPRGGYEIELLGVWGTLSEAQDACNRRQIRDENGNGRDPEANIDFDEAVTPDMDYGTWPYGLDDSDTELKRPVVSLHRGNGSEYEIIGYELNAAEIEREHRLAVNIVAENAADTLAKLSWLQDEINTLLAKLPPPPDQPDEMLRRALYGDEETT